MNLWKEAAHPEPGEQYNTPNKTVISVPMLRLWRAVFDTSGCGAYLRRTNPARLSQNVHNQDSNASDRRVRSEV